MGILDDLRRKAIKESHSRGIVRNDATDLEVGAYNGNDITLEEVIAIGKKKLNDVRVHINDLPALDDFKKKVIDYDIVDKSNKALGAFSNEVNEYLRGLGSGTPTDIQDIPNGFEEDLASSINEDVDNSYKDFSFLTNMKSFKFDVNHSPLLRNETYKRLQNSIGEEFPYTITLYTDIPPNKFNKYVKVTTDRSGKEVYAFVGEILTRGYKTDDANILAGYKSGNFGKNIGFYTNSGEEYKLYEDYEAIYGIGIHDNVPIWDLHELQYHWLKNPWEDYPRPELGLGERDAPFGLLSKDGTRFAIYRIIDWWGWEDGEDVTNDVLNQDVEFPKPSYSNDPYDTSFDNRLARNYTFDDGDIITTLPYSAISGTSILKEYLAPFVSKEENPEQFASNMERFHTMKANPNYYAVRSIMNPYSVTRLYGALDVSYDTNFGASVKQNRLIDKHNRKRFYDINSIDAGDITAVSNPTTTNIIKYGSADKWGRIPYTFQDFIFCKHWNIIPNNRLITLRRYKEPCLDNLNFPDLSKSKDGVETNSNRNLSPISTMVTYFGDDTENSIKSLVGGIMSGYNWGDLTSDIWEVSTQSPALAMGGVGSTIDAIGSGMSKAIKAMNFLTGILGDNFKDYYNGINVNQVIDINSFPDPYENGAYSNRIEGPLNSINSVKQRVKGMLFNHSITLTFKYVARPFGNINTKAVMLDIMSNALAMGTGSAIFFKGAHRFAITPSLAPISGTFTKLYNLIQNENKYYEALDMLKTLILEKINPSETLDQIIGTVGNFFGDTIDKVTGNFEENSSKIKEYANGKLSEIMETIKNGDKTKGREIMVSLASSLFGFKFFTGKRALLLGEPVGDWHLTIGNPLNPIAMIGNLVCKSVTIDFSEELGVDDFPIEMTIKYVLEHGMNRDKDAIESMFNRGAGRIYTLPDWAKTSADRNTKVDKYSQYASDGTGKGAGRPGWSISELYGKDYVYNPADRTQNNRKHAKNQVNIEKGVNYDEIATAKSVELLNIPRYTPSLYNETYDFSQLQNPELLVARASYLMSSNEDNIIERANKT